MNPRALALITSLALSGSAFSQSNWGSVGSLTVALTLSYQSEALMLKDSAGKVLPATEAGGGGPTFTNSFSVDTLDRDGNITKTVATEEYGSKISSSWRWGNAEIIRALVENEILPQIGKAPFIAGWSLVVVYDGAEAAPTVYARHTDKTTILLDSVILGGPEDFYVAAITDRTVTTTLNNVLTGASTETALRTYSNTFKGTGSASVPFYFGDLRCKGLLTGSYRYVAQSEGTGVNRVITQVLVPGATKIDKILGGGSSEGLLIEGSISAAAAVVTNLYTYFPAP